MARASRSRLLDCQNHGRSADLPPVPARQPGPDGHGLWCEPDLGGATPMPAFTTPLVDPAAWTYTTSTLSVPSGLRYGGYAFRSVTATNTIGTVQVPSTGVLRK